ncbi:transcriptional regulator FilR1 domain-containing protein (plasmid) [Haladaptatus sp. SPP-AMP-3]|uniref:helix-turn-helix transcriptional regulator n=1 Tax=Haladaptatus sp. SPP-AMP-3 TaxID=3121295 RepID=UPI003C2FED2C
MEHQQSLTEYVLRSGARTAVLQAIVDGCETTRALLNRDLASESAVYNALTELENRGLIYSPRTKRWAPTGIGSVVSALVREQRKTERVLRIDIDYWKQHDVTALPSSDLLRIADLTGGTVVRATDTHPSRAVREVERRLETTTSASVIAPIFNERYSDALLDGDGDARLVLATDVLHSLLATTDATVDEDLNVRVADASFALTVTDDSVLLSLPLLDGSYDTQTEFVVETDRARRKANELFEAVWADAKPADEYVESMETDLT